MAWIEPSRYWAELPALHGAAGGLITAPGGKVLLVKPSYADRWGFPGGSMDEGEAPDQTAAREIREEIGLTVVIGTLLVVDLQPPDGGARTRSILHFLFDAGEVADLTGVVRQREELDDVALFGVEEAVERMSPSGGPRLLAGLRARQIGQTILTH
jgi:8-oxo-dGTP diphosphatase